MSPPEEAVKVPLALVVFNEMCFRVIVMESGSVITGLKVRLLLLMGKEWEYLNII